MPTYDITDLYGKNLTLAKKCKARLLPDITSQVLKEYAPGDKLAVFSSVTKGSYIFFMVDITTSKTGWVVYEKGMFDNVSLQVNNVLSLDEKLEAKKEAENADKDIFTLFKENITSIMSIAKWLLIIVLIVIIAFELEKRYHWTKKIHLKK